MEESEYQPFYERVGSINGWNFSNVKCTSEGVEWDFFREVAKRCKPSDLLLDIGTGGAEALISIADAALLLVGIDASTGMIDTAINNIQASKKPNVRALRMNAERIAFPAQFFHVACARHAPFNAAEVARILVPGGVFLTQQVSEGDKLNVIQAFGRGQTLGVPDGALMERYKIELRQAGFTHIIAAEYDATDYFETPEDLLFILKHTPIIPEFGMHGQDGETFDAFVNAHRTDKGIRTNSKRFMITARK